MEPRCWLASSTVASNNLYQRPGAIAAARPIPVKAGASPYLSGGGFTCDLPAVVVEENASPEVGRTATRNKRNARDEAEGSQRLALQQRHPSNKGYKVGNSRNTNSQAYSAAALSHGSL